MISHEIDKITRKVYVVNPNGGPALPRDVIFPEELQELLGVGEPDREQRLDKIRREYLKDQT